MNRKNKIIQLLPVITFFIILIYIISIDDYEKAITTSTMTLIHMDLGFPLVHYIIFNASFLIIINGLINLVTKKFLYKSIFRRILFVIVALISNISIIFLKVYIWAYYTTILIRWDYMNTPFSSPNMRSLNFVILLVCYLLLLIIVERTISYLINLITSPNDSDAILSEELTNDETTIISLGNLYYKESKNIDEKSIIYVFTTNKKLAFHFYDHNVAKKLSVRLGGNVEIIK